MLKKIKTFFITSILGGLTVILPIALVLMVFNWLFNKFSSIITPITKFIMEKSNIQEILADTIVLALILIICFAIGFIEKTRLGNFLVKTIERFILRPIPGYGLVKETILQLIGTGKNPFSSVALVDLFGTETRVTAFITDEHENGSFTVFVPTGPNPTSGGIFHVESYQVQKTDISIEQAMKSIISCGHGSKSLLRRGL